jgi:hypothetical protein
MEKKLEQSPQPSQLPQQQESPLQDFNSELDAYKYLKDEGLPYVRFKPSRMGDSYQDRTIDSE